MNESIFSIREIFGIAIFSAVVIPLVIGVFMSDDGLGRNPGGKLILLLVVIISAPIWVPIAILTWICECLGLTGQYFNND